MTLRGILPSLLLVAGCASAPYSGTDRMGELWDHYAEGEPDARVSVAVVKDGLPVFSGDSQRVYPLGEIGWIFLEEAASRLARKGSIDLDRPITAYTTSSLDPLEARYTLRNLLDRRNPYRERLYRAILRDAAGKELDDVLFEEIVRPLGLRHTRLDRDGMLWSTAADCALFFASSPELRDSRFFEDFSIGGRILRYASGRHRAGGSFVVYRAGSRDFFVVLRERRLRPVREDFLLADTYFETQAMKPKKRSKFR